MNYSTYLAKWILKRGCEFWNKFCWHWCWWTAGWRGFAFGTVLTASSLTRSRCHSSAGVLPDWRHLRTCSRTSFTLPGITSIYDTTWFILHYHRSL